MNRYKFYYNLNKYKSLQHSSKYGDKYYTKLDNYYPDGSSRYFYSRQEWEAYQIDKGQDEWKKQQAQKKEAENRSGMSSYTEWKKNEDKKKKIEKDKKESIEKNKSASEHEGDRWQKPQQNNKVAEENKLNKAISGRETAIQKAYKDEQERRKEEKYKKLYQYKDEIIKKANEYLKTTNGEINSFLDNFMDDFSPELKDKVLDVIDKIKDSIENVIEKIDNVSEEEIANIYNFIDKIVDKVQDKINKYSNELDEIYQKVKDKIGPVFKDEDGNIDWKLYLAAAAGVGALKFIIQNPELCLETLGKIYDTGKKTFNFVNEKTNGAFSAALAQIGRKIENYYVYQKFKNQGLGTFHVVDDNGNKVTYLDKSYDNWLKASGQK